MKPIAALSFAAALTTCVGFPMAAHAEDSSLTAYVAHADVSDGFEDRDVVGAFVNVERGDVGFHADFAHVDREEDGTYLALGLSWQASDTLRPKLMIGTSTDNFSILPELYASASLQYKPADTEGLVITPALTYREYRSGGEEIAPAVEVARYFNMAGDDGGYWVAQGRVSASFNSSDDDGWSLGGSIQTVRESGWNLGLSAEFGRMTYDSVIGIGVESDYWAVRPSVGHRIGEKHEIFIRGEFADTDFYTVRGVMLGVKIAG